MFRPCIGLRAEERCEDFMRERYKCVQEASRQKSSGYANSYGGAMQSRPVVSLGLFQACLRASGRRQGPSGFSPPQDGKMLMED
jgi:hypothetical protein